MAPVSGRGRVVSLTVNLQPWYPTMPPPYVIGVVALEEDPTVRITASIVHCDAASLTQGTPVEVQFEQVNDVWIPVFTPAVKASENAMPTVPVPTIEEILTIPKRRHQASDKFEERVAITGIGMSRLGRKLMVDPLTLTIEACQAAVDDAGLRMEDIDGLSTYPGEAGDDGFSEGGAYALEACLGIRPAWHNGGAEVPGANGVLVNAMLAVASGMCRHVLCFRTVWQSTHAELVRSGRWPNPPERPATGWLTWLSPYGGVAANVAAMAAGRYFERYGADRKTLGWIALNARANAVRNPIALYRDPMTMDEYLSARMVSTPLSLYDMDPLCDGSTAVIISARETAGDLRRKPVFVEAAGTHIAEPIAWDQGTLDHAPGIFGPAAHLWSRTSLKPDDVDVAELYDGFTFACLTWIEALGFCGIGEAKDFLTDGKNIGPEGLLPLNTHGGQLSHGRTHGMGLIYEAITQLRGDAGDRQIRNAHVAVTSNGVLSPSAALLLRTD